MLRWRRYRAPDGEILVIIGWGFAAVAAISGVAFLVKMAYWKPTKLREEQDKRSRRKE